MSQSSRLRKATLAKFIKRRLLRFICMIHRDPTRRQRLAYSKHKLQKVSIISVIVKYVLPNEKKKKESGPKRRSTSALRIFRRRRL